MQSSTNILTRVSAAVLVALGSMNHAAHAFDIGEQTEIHGFGFQGYVDTQGNPYLGADGNGTWDYNTLSLIFATHLDDKTKLWAMLDNNSEGTRLGWMFIDRQLTDQLSVRGGQAKLPWGFYNDILDARFLQQSAVLPAIYSDSADMRDEAYRGVGTTYALGSLTFDGYAGAVVDLGQSVDNTDFADQRLFGGRVTYKTPIDGVTLMASAFSNGMKDKITNVSKSVKSGVVGAEYVKDNWDVKAEYAEKKFLHQTDGYYVQAGYTFGEKWTPYARYDSIVLNKSLRDDPSYYQRAYVFGIDYKISGNVSVRIEDHVNHGYGLPVGSAEVVAGTGKTNWGMFAASLNFIF